MMAFGIQKIGAFRRLLSDIGGLAIVEFAFLLPVMVGIYFGTIEITQAMIAKRKLNLAVFTMGDLTSQADINPTSQVQTIGSADLTAYFGSAAAVMAPINVTGLQMRVTSVVVYPLGLTCVDWSVTNNTSSTNAMPALAAGAPYAMPASILASASLSARDFIVVEAQLPYRPITHSFMPGGFKLREGPTYIVPRQTTRIMADTTVQNPASHCA